jgi:hypothetical protein
MCIHLHFACSDIPLYTLGCVRSTQIPLLFDGFHCFFETLFTKTLRCSTTFLKRFFSRFLAIPLLFFVLGFWPTEKKQRNASADLTHHTVQNRKKKLKVCEIWKNRSIEKRGLKHCFKKRRFAAADRINLKQCFFSGIHRTHPYVICTFRYIPRNPLILPFYI